MQSAIIATGGKQYLVKEGEALRVEKLTAKEGEKVVFTDVLLIDDGVTTQVGTPYIAGAKIEATLVREGRGKKILVQKFKSKVNYKRRMGHRQSFSEVSVTKLP